ncbi:30S ribosomal protein S9 [Candidatus Shapirobacteria bacterium]|nr:30S ribosomal protein S9 [Candidatus Shapirobacteria bacterium]
METQKIAKKPVARAVGSRRRATARVWLYRGKGESLVNGKKMSEYFPSPLAQARFLAPFVLTKTEGRFWVSVRVVGGGFNGQLEAVIHGIARALANLDKEKYRQALKEAGLLTRDPRERERRKAGMGGKARRKRQSPKR